MTWLRSLNKLNMGALRRCATRDVKRAPSNPGDQSGPDPDNLKDTAFGKTVDIMGMLYRGPGRFLVAEDEWFKTLAYRAELHSQAYRHGMKIFAETGSKEEASRAAALFMSNPPPAIVSAAKDKATENIKNIQSLFSKD